jgi:hypothetical protein
MTDYFPLQYSITTHKLCSIIWDEMREVSAPKLVITCHTAENDQPSHGSSAQLTKPTIRQLSYSHSCPPIDRFSTVSSSSAIAI